MSESVLASYAQCKSTSDLEVATMQFTGFFDGDLMRNVCWFGSRHA